MIVLIFFEVLSTFRGTRRTASSGLFLPEFCQFRVLLLLRVTAETARWSSFPGGRLRAGSFVLWGDRPSETKLERWDGLESILIIFSMRDGPEKKLPSDCKEVASGSG